MVNSGRLTYLSEGFMDAMKRAWNKAKIYVTKLWKKVKSWIATSVNRMMDFLEIKPSMQFKNEIVW